MMMLQPLSDTGFPGEGTVFDVASFRLRVLDGPHPYAVENEAAIAENWQREQAANPHLFNGEMVFQRRLTLENGHIEGEAHRIPFAAFLHWRRGGRGLDGHHLFAMPVILSRDGAVMAVRMAQTTANPGRVYSPAGSLDAHDIVAGLCDLSGNMRRETLEETGIDLTHLDAEPRLRGVHMANSLAIFQVFRSDRTAEALRSDVLAHVAGEAEPEISDFLAIRSPDAAAHDYSPSMPPVLDWVFRHDTTMKV